MGIGGWGGTKVVLVVECGGEEVVVDKTVWWLGRCGD